MNLLEYSIETIETMNQIQSGEEFAKYFVQRKCECYMLFSNGLITSTSHGIDFFNNVIKYWDNPHEYKKTKEKNVVDYEYNFVQLIINNKK